MNVGLSDVTIEYNSDALRTLFGNGCIFGPSSSAWHISVSMLVYTLHHVIIVGIVDVNCLVAGDFLWLV